MNLSLKTLFFFFCLKSFKSFYQSYIKYKYILKKIMDEIKFEEKFCEDITEPNKICEFLDNLKKNNKEEDYINSLQLYYPILPPEIY